QQLENMREERDSWMERVTSNVADDYFNESRLELINGNILLKVIYSHLTLSKNEQNNAWLFSIDVKSYMQEFERRHLLNHSSMSLSLR
ncbi:10291_t:CDS:2, partial [Dentiscutata erythropus]